MAVFLLIIFTVLGSGCATTKQITDKLPRAIKHPLQETFRGNQQKNREPFPVNNQIDYSDYDQEFQYDIVGNRAYRAQEEVPSEENVQKDGDQNVCKVDREKNADMVDPRPTLCKWVDPVKESYIHGSKPQILISKF